MPPKPRKIMLVLSGIMLVCMLISAYLDWHSLPGLRFWGHVFDGILLLNQLFLLWMMKRYPGNRPVPNPLIGLFPKPEQPQQRHK